MRTERRCAEAQCGQVGGIGRAVHRTNNRNGLPTSANESDRARRRGRRRRAAGTTRLLLHWRPSRPHRRRENEPGGRRTNHRELGSPTSHRKTRLILVLSALINRRADTAQFPAQRQPHRLGERHGRRVTHKHPAPARHLHDVPLSPGGQQAGEQHHDDFEALGHSDEEFTE